MVLDTACGAFAPSNSMASGILFRVSVPVQVRFSASVCGGTSPLFAPVAVGGVAPGGGVGEAVGVPGPPLKYSTCAVVAAVSTTTAMTTPTTLSRTRRFRLVSWTDCRAWYTRRRARSSRAPRALDATGGPFLDIAECLRYASARDSPIRLRQLYERSGRAHGYG